jgi:pimeloyl-ACP methyl ester carboxylesterase
MFPFELEYDDHHSKESVMSHAHTLTRPTPDQVLQAFLTPRPPRAPAPDFLPDAERLHVDTPVGRVALQRTGTGRPVLLLHGWEGQAADLAAFVQPLLDAGFQVVAMDLPAHGASAGRQTSIPDSARALRAVGEALGPLQAVIAHSVGSAVLAEALHAGLAAERAVLVAAPAHYADYARQVGHLAGLDNDGIGRLLALLSASFGVDIHDISLPGRAAGLRQPALFVHSADDRIVSIADSEASAAAWPGAHHLRLDGLGHRRVLQAPAVIDSVLQFLTPSPHASTLPLTQEHSS